MPVGSGRSVRLRHAVGAGADMMARRKGKSSQKVILSLQKGCILEALR